MSTPFLGLIPARPLWGADDQPEDPASGDVYFSRDDGLAETRNVFFAGCDLPERWQASETHVICETGFGTGLNFLASWGLWRQTRKPRQYLHFISVEAHPWNRADLQKAHQRFPELDTLAAKLRQQWPPAIKGMHQLHWEDDHLTLTLLFGDAAQMLAELDAQVDSWFLDGFAPAKNPDMWSDAIFKQMARLSAPGAHIGTYTVAGAVRRGLAAHGFIVERLPGHGRKRQRLHARAATCKLEKPASSKTAIIIGAGIAGACLAFLLRQQEVDVLVLDQTGPASAASGNPRGMVNPRLDLSDAPMARLHRTAFAHAIRFYRQYCPDSFSATGILRHAKSPTDRDKQQNLVEAQALPADWAELCDEGLVLPTAGTLDPQQAIASLLAGISHRQAQANGLLQVDDGWCALDDAGDELARADLVFVANGAFPAPLDDLPPLRLLRGQVSVAQIRAHGLQMGETAASYCLPLDRDHILFGATHDRVDTSSDDERPQDHARNIAAFARLHARLAAQIDPQTLTGRAATRAASFDQQPFAGPVPDLRRMPEWARTARGKHPDLSSAPKRTGLFMLNGLGSLGLTLAPLVAKMVVAQALDQPMPVERSAQMAIAPARDFLRRFRRGETG